MLRNCEKMVLISSTSNEWPQPQQQQNNFIDDPKTTFNSVMDHHKVAAIAQDQQQQQQQKQQQQQQQQQNQEALRCPRCDSTNTKFCYYNNYSLTQPRHFCKACKRYWTRGGTLRNVPVGGGCRKNKRVKRPSNNNNSSSMMSHSCTSVEVNSSGVGVGVGGGGALSSLSHTSGGSHIHDLINGAASNHNHNHNHNQPLFYGLPANHSTNNSSDINFPFSRYDLQPPPHQINSLGLGFSSSGLVQNMNTMNLHNNTITTKQIFQDLMISSSSNPTTTTTTTTAAAAVAAAAPSQSISSLLASSLHQMKGGNNNFHSLLPSYEDDLNSMKSSGMFNNNNKDGVKMEFQGQHRSSSTLLDHHHHWNNSNNNNTPHQNHQMDQNLSDPSSILWGSNNAPPNFSAWLDPSNNIGSSVPSLI